MPDDAYNIPGPATSNIQSQITLAKNESKSLEFN